MISRSLVKKIYKPRPKWSHKGMYGKLLIVGGSSLYSGSPIFNGLAAYRSGCDIVKIAAPEKAARAIKAYAPDLITHPLKGDFLSRKHVPVIKEMQKSCDALIIGCGLGRSRETLAAIRSIIKTAKVPCVLDADALYAVNSKLGKNFVLTPHSHEFYVLSKKKVTADLKSRSIAVKALAKKLDCTVLLKGHVDVVSDGMRTDFNETGSVFMTKGGFGDTLAGICGALLARGVKPFEAACAAAYINGKAGQLAARKYKEGVMASDLLKEIPEVIEL